MSEDKSLLMKSAMTYGLLMGVYWIFKYLFFISSIYFPITSTIYWGFTFIVPLIAYIFTLRYKQDIGGTIGFFHAWQYGILIYLFAALVVSLMHYLFYRYWAPSDLIENSFNEVVNMLKAANLSPEIEKAIGEMTMPTPIKMVISQLFNNIFYGIIFSVPVAALACRKNAPGSRNDNSTNTTV